MSIVTIYDETNRSFSIKFQPHYFYEVVVTETNLRPITLFCYSVFFLLNVFITESNLFYILFQRTNKSVFFISSVIHSTANSNCAELEMNVALKLLFFFF